MCLEAVAEVLGAMREAQSKGGLPERGSVVVVGSGKPSAGRTVLKSVGAENVPSGWTLDVCCDPGLESYRQMGLVRGVSRTFKWKRRDNVLGLLLYPFNCCCRCLCPCTAGDPWQQGGVFIFGPAGESVSVRPLFEHRDESPGWPLLDVKAFAEGLARKE